MICGRLQQLEFAPSRHLKVLRIPEQAPCLIDLVACETPISGDLIVFWPFYAVAGPAGILAPILAGALPAFLIVLLGWRVYK
jgi:hypothetical protein